VMYARCCRSYLPKSKNSRAVSIPFADQKQKPEVSAPQAVCDVVRAALPSSK